MILLVVHVLPFFVLVVWFFCRLSLLVLLVLWWCFVYCWFRCLVVCGRCCRWCACRVLYGFVYFVAEFLFLLCGVWPMCTLLVLSLVGSFVVWLLLRAFVLAWMVLFVLLVRISSCCAGGLKPFAFFVFARHRSQQCFCQGKHRSLGSCYHEDSNRLPGVHCLVGTLPADISMNFWYSLHSLP
uniref:Uncharacterized protein n=1 Tax=Anopheles darlingi TaxID=43151 RepID=A0A2M4D8M7_ANODA